MRVAFATQFGLPSPEAFGDRMSIAPRWRADARSVIAAELDGRLVGSNVVTTWGRFGWFGPLTILPDVWNRGVAQALMEPTMRHFVERGTTAEALFTLPSSPKHLALYQRYGFWPRRLTAMLARPPDAAVPVAFVRFSALAAAERAAALAGMRALCGRLFEGLDVTLEVEALAAQQLGETLIVDGPDGAIGGFAVCHQGAGSEAGSKDASVKFGAAVDEASFRRLLDAVLAYGAQAGVERVVVGINTAREAAYRAALERGFRIAMLGVAMVRGGAAYDDPGAWVIEDHR